MGTRTKINVGVLGGGVMAHRHILSLLTLPVVELRGVSAVEIRPEVSGLCDTAGVAVSNEASWLFEQADLDAVVIATPTDSHSELVCEAAAAGLHVFCEKPLALTAPEAQAAVDACAAAQVKLAVGHVVRYFPAYAEIRAAVVDGQIGAPGMAKCRRVSGPPGAASAWYNDRARSGGVITDMGVHDFDWLRWCLGPVRRVSALSTEVGAGQVAMVTLAHESGAISTIELSWMDPKGFATAVEVSGPKGLLRHSSRGSASFYLDRWPLTERSSPVVDVPVEETLDNPYRHEIADAISWFRGGRAPRSDGADAVAAVALAQAAAASAARRQPVLMAGSFPEGAA